MNTQSVRALVLAGILAVVVSIPLFAADIDQLLDRVDATASLDPDSVAKLVREIKAHGAVLSGPLLHRLQKDGLTDQQQAIYVWALGFTGDAGAVPAIAEVHEGTKSELVKRNCRLALASIGGPQAGEFLLGILRTVSDPDTRLDIVEFLAQMHYEPVLPLTREVLTLDSKEFYYQPMFVFGKMGDNAIPFLLSRISDEDRNVRTNVMIVLGAVLIPAEATTPLENRFWIEQDPPLRTAIQAALERLNPDLDHMKSFFEQVVAAEQDQGVRKFAGETLADIPRMKSELAEFRRRNKPSASSFRQIYEELFDSTGKLGSYDQLEVFSSSGDEPELKVLREHILLRGSDEALSDLHKVNRIIIHNRRAGVSVVGPPR